MMYARLRLARDFLDENGIIFISIDDGEFANLRKICDEIFGEEKFIASFIWKSRQNKDKGARKHAVPFRVQHNHAFSGGGKLCQQHARERGFPDARFTQDFDVILVQLRVWKQHWLPVLAKPHEDLVTPCPACFLDEWGGIKGACKQAHFSGVIQNVRRASPDRTVGTLMGQPQAQYVLRSL